MLPTDLAVAPTDSPDAELALEQLVLFVVDGHHFAFPIETVREIVPSHAYTRLPGADDTVCGLINLRGRILTVVDLGTVMHLPASARLRDHSIVIVERDLRLVGVAVDDVAGIVSVAPESLSASADALRSLQIDRAYLRGVGEADDRIFIAVDPDAILAPLLA